MACGGSLFIVICDSPAGGVSFVFKVQVYKKFKMFNLFRPFSKFR